MSAHTSGPWHVYHSIYGPVVDCADNYPVAKLHWGHVGREDMPDNETLANARLIAAAPELLQVARDYVLLCQLHDLEGAVLDAAKAAIARAEGKENQ